MGEKSTSTTPLVRRAAWGLGVAVGVGSSVINGSAAGASPVLPRQDSGQAASAESQALAQNAGSGVAAAADFPDANGDGVKDGAECPTANPTDGQIIHTRAVVHPTHGEIGRVSLIYSPSARCVQAKVLNDRYADGGTVAFVYKPSVNQITARTYGSATKAVTGWVNDYHICQSALGLVGLYNDFGYGETPCY